MENQVFWTPPHPSRRNTTAQYTPLLPMPLPPSLDQNHESLDATVQHEPTSTYHISEQRPVYIQGQTVDAPICIPSDINSEGDGIGDTVADDNYERHFDYFSWLQSDDTLPPIEELLGSPIKKPCGNTRMPELEQHGSENDSEASSTNSIAKQPVASQDREDRDGMPADVPTALTTNEATVHSATTCPPISTQMDHTPPSPVGPTAYESDATLPDVEDYQSAESPINSTLCLVRRRSPRISARTSNMRRCCESPGGSVSKSSLAASRLVRDQKTGDGELAKSRDALQHDDCDANSSLDLDGFPETGLSQDDDYSPSSPDNDGKQQDYCQADEADEPPRKRCKTKHSMADARSHCASSIRSTSASVKPSTINKHVSTAGLHTPPQSLASSTGEDGKSESATFEEWTGMVKLTTINGVTTFEGQFDGQLSLNLLQALVQTWSSTQKTIPPVCGKARVVGNSRGKFTTEEDDLIVKLKAELNLPWSDIHRRFCDQFPRRSKGGLQVRYCTKLKDRR